MKEVAILILGWFLGLFSPLILDRIRARQHRTLIARGIASELTDLRYRCAITCVFLTQRYGTLTRELLVWVRPFVQDYEGNEPSEHIRQFIDRMVDSSDDELLTVAKYLRTHSNTGAGLKTLAAGFLESHLGEIRQFPISYQKAIHEARYHLSTTNEEIEAATKLYWMTFDSSLTQENHAIVRSELITKYTTIASMLRLLCDRITNVLNDSVSASK